VRECVNLEAGGEVAFAGTSTKVSHTVFGGKMTFGNDVVEA
jgi:hypothetical protein